MSIERYFIKEGYVPNEAAKTFELEPGEYWTRERLKTSYSFQYYVYELASRTATEKKYEVGMDLGCGPATKSRDILRPSLKELYLVDQPNCESIARKSVPDATFYGVNLESFQLTMQEPMDIIVCADVIEHINDPLPSIKFAYDNLADNGLAFFSTPERDILRGVDCKSSPHNAHVREWNRQELKALLEYAGFHVIEQILLPPKKLSLLDEALWKLTHPMKPKFTSCQLAICKKRN